MAATEGPAHVAEAACHVETREPDAAGEQLHETAGLTEAQLMEVFKQTSIFNVRSALANNHALMSAREVHEASDRWAGLRHFYHYAYRIEWSLRMFDREPEEVSWRRDCVYQPTQPQPTV